MGTNLMDWGSDGTMEGKGEGKLASLSLLPGQTKRTANSYLHGQSPNTSPLPCQDGVYLLKPEPK